MTSNESKIEKVQKHFQALTDVATSLNTASDELTKVVGVLDEALKKLGMGLTVWVIFCDRGDERNPERYDCDQIGYAKVNSKWGIALRHIWGHEGFDDYNEEGPWLFNDASREMRLRSVDKIADVIESLAKTAIETTKKIQEKTKEVSELADALAKIANESQKPSRMAEAFRQTGSRTPPKDATIPSVGEILVPEPTNQPIDDLEVLRRKLKKLEESLAGRDSKKGGK